MRIEKTITQLSDLQAYFLFVFLRIINGLFLQTVAHADEFWQGPEVAHKHVFGYGYLTWEWTYELPIRNPFVFGLYYILYFILQAFNLDTTWMIAYGPRVFQALLTAVFDLTFAKLAIRLTEIKNFAFWTLINYTTWYALYLMPRTLINTNETTLFTLAFYLWKLAFTEQKHDLKLEIAARILIAINFVMRPTSINIWFPVWMFEAFSNFNPKRFFVFSLKCFLNVILMLLISIATDSLFYGKLTWTAFNFYYLNVFKNIAALYGVDGFFWYFKQTIPEFVGPWFPALIVGAFVYTKTCRTKSIIPELIMIPVFNILFLSTSQHKESRFILKVMPFAFIMIGIGIKKIYERIKQKKFATMLIFLAISTSFSNFVYYGMIEHSGSVIAIDYLRNEPVTEAIIFTRCHLTPYYAMIHKKIPLHFPECSPFDENISNYHLLNLAPSYFIQTWLEKINPSHVIIYNYLLRDEEVSAIFKEWEFSEDKFFFNRYMETTAIGDVFWYGLVALKKKH